MKTKLLLFVLFFTFSNSISQSQIVKTFKEHDGDVLCIKFFPNSMKFATGGTDDNLIIWDYDKMRKEVKLESQLSDILSIVISKDESKIYTGHKSPKIKITETDKYTLGVWDLNSKIVSHNTGYTENVNGLCLSPDGNKLISIWYYYEQDATYSSNKAYITKKIFNYEYNLESNEMTNYNLFEDSYPTEYISKSRDKSISVYSFILTEPKNGYIFGCLENGYIAMISLSDKKYIKYFHTDKNKFSGSCIDVSSDGKLIAAANYGGENWIYIWNVSTGESIKTLKGHKNDVLCTSFSPDGKFLASGDEDGVIILWDVNTGKKIQSLFGHKDNVNCISFSPDGKYIVSGGSDKKVIVWDALSVLPDLKTYAAEYELKYGLHKKLTDELKEQINFIQSNFQSKGEFETTEEFEERLREKNDKIKGITDFYQTKLYELTETKKKELDDLTEKKTFANEDIIQKSRKDTVVKITNISNYNADNQTFSITIKGFTKNVFIPIDKAPKFKENWKKAKVKCKMQLFDDLKNYKYFDFVILDPVTNEEIIFQDVSETK